MQELEKTMKSLGNVEAKLFRQVLVYSFVFPMLAILAQYDKFDAPFQALTELLAGTIGAAGILSAYLGSLRHAADELEELLNFKPQRWGARVSFSLGLSAIFFYGFYFFARQSNQICLVFLCAGVFVFFQTLTGSVLTISRVEKQRRLWRAMGSERRRIWLEEREKLKDFLVDFKRESQVHIAETDAAIANAKAVQKEVRRDRSRRKREEFFEELRSRTFGFRSKIGLVTADEEFRQIELEEEVEETLQEWTRKIHEENVSRISQGEIPGLKMEGSDLQIFEVGSWKYFHLKGLANSDTVQRILQDIHVSEKDEEELCQSFVVITDSSTQLTYEASQMLSRVGIPTVQEQAEFKFDSGGRICENTVG